MADARPFRALRFDSARVDPAATIAPPYDVISSGQQAELYQRSPHNIIRVEYGEQRPGDTAVSNRYTRAAQALRSWTDEQVLLRDIEPAMYAYTLSFAWEGAQYQRSHVFLRVRLEAWDRGIVRPHEHTLSGPKADRMELLRATRTQVSPVYCLSGAPVPVVSGERLYEFEVGGQRHALSRIDRTDGIAAIAEALQRTPLYIADGHHRYETALAYRSECRDRAASWSGEEGANFVLMAISAASDPGLLVLPTHRLIHVPACAEAMSRIREHFDVQQVSASAAAAGLAAGPPGETVFILAGIEPDACHLLRLRDRPAVEALMPAGESPAWKRLDVNVLQYALLEPLFGITEDVLRRGNAVSYTQSLDEALTAVSSDAATCAFLLNATPVDQIIAVSDADGRMPQKSTYFHPKLPTGLVLNPLD